MVRPLILNPSDKSKFKQLSADLALEVPGDSTIGTSSDDVLTVNSTSTFNAPVTFNSDAYLSPSVALVWAQVGLRGSPVYFSASMTVDKAVATNISTCRVVGLGSASADSVLVSGVSDASFVPGLTLAIGEPIYVSKTSGKLTNDVAGYSAGDVIAEVGLLASVGTYNSGDGSGYGKIAIQIKTPRMI